MFVHIVKTVLNQELKIPFPRLPYEQSIRRYGTDKPDLRFGMEIINVKEALEEKDFPPFRDKGEIRGLMIDEGGGISRKRLDEINEQAKNAGLIGVFWAKREEKYSGSIAKLLDENIA